MTEMERILELQKQNLELVNATRDLAKGLASLSQSVLDLSRIVTAHLAQHREELNGKREG